MTEKEKEKLREEGRKQMIGVILYSMTSVVDIGGVISGHIEISKEFLKQYKISEVKK